MREGDKNGRSKLTWEIVREIRRRYRKGPVSTYTLALDYNVAQGTIYPIIAGTSWREKKNKKKVGQ
jgi:hypothetical protein